MAGDDRVAAGRRSNGRVRLKSNIIMLSLFGRLRPTCAPKFNLKTLSPFIRSVVVVVYVVVVAVLVQRRLTFGELSLVQFRYDDGKAAGVDEFVHGVV